MSANWCFATASSTPSRWVQLEQWLDGCNVTEVIGRFTALSDQEIPIVLNPKFGRTWVAQESERAGASRVGARLKNTDQIADFHFRQEDGTAESVERSAKRADKVYGFCC